MNDAEKYLLAHPHLFGRYLGFTLLTPVHSEWIARWLAARCDISHQAHRGSYKTTCLVVFVVMLLLSDPDVTILYMRKEHTSATSVVDQIRKVLESSQALHFFQLVHGSGLKRLASGTWSKHKLVLSCRRSSESKEGNVDAGGIEVKTGAHYDVIIFDDGITRKDRRSAAERKITDDAVHELKNIRNPGGRTLFIGTRWHERDSWRLMPEPECWPLGSIDLPEFTEERKRELKATLPRSIYASQYELKHVPDEARMFAAPEFGALPDHLDLVFALDPAYKGDATTALIGAGIDHVTGLIHAVGRVWPGHVAEVYDEILDFLGEFRTSLLIVETNADKELSLDALRELAENRGESHLYSIEGKHETEGKHERISVRIKRVWRKLRLDPIRFEIDAQDQLTEYAEGAEPCDAPDALAAALAALPETEPGAYSAGDYT